MISENLIGNYYMLRDLDNTYNTILKESNLIILDEGFNDSISKLWDNIVKFIKSVFDKIVDLYNKLIKFFRDFSNKMVSRFFHKEDKDLVIKIADRLPNDYKFEGFFFRDSCNAYDLVDPVSNFVNKINELLDKMYQNEKLDNAFNLTGEFTTAEDKLKDIFTNKLCCDDHIDSMEQLENAIRRFIGCDIPFTFTKSNIKEFINDISDRVLNNKNGNYSKNLSESLNLSKESLNNQISKIKENKKKLTKIVDNESGSNYYNLTMKYIKTYCSYITIINSAIVGAYREMFIQDCKILKDILKYKNVNESFTFEINLENAELIHDDEVIYNPEDAQLF